MQIVWLSNDKSLITLKWFDAEFLWLLQIYFIYDKHIMFENYQKLKCALSSSLNKRKVNGNWQNCLIFRFPVKNNFNKQL